MFVQALSGAASFAACLRLFPVLPARRVTVLFRWLAPLNRPAPRRFSPTVPSSTAPATGPATSSQLTTTSSPCGRGTRPTGSARRSGRGAPVSVASHRIITEGMPVPRDGALLGWVSDRRATALLSVYHEQWHRQSACPRYGSWPWSTASPCGGRRSAPSPLDNGRLWEYVEPGRDRGLAPLIVRDPKVRSGCRRSTQARPSPGTRLRGGRRTCSPTTTGCPCGTYMDHWMLPRGRPEPAREPAARPAWRHGPVQAADRLVAARLVAAARGGLGPRRLAEEAMAGREVPMRP